MGYSTHDVVYRWRFGLVGSVKFSPDVTLSQFDMIDYAASNSTAILKGGKANVIRIIRKYDIITQSI